MEFLHPAMWHDHDIDFVRWLHPAMWNRDSEFTKWQQPAMWYVALGWYTIEFAQTSAILEFYIWFPFPHNTAVDMSLCTSLRNFLPNWTTLGRKKWRHVDFPDGGSQRVLDFRGPIMSSSKSPGTTSYRSSIALNCLVFEKVAFFCILATDRLTDRQTDKQMDSTDPLSRSRCRERGLNNDLT